MLKSGWRNFMKKLQTIHSHFLFSRRSLAPTFKKMFISLLVLDFISEFFSHSKVNVHNKRNHSKIIRVYKSFRIPTARISLVFPKKSHWHRAKHWLTNFRLYWIPPLIEVPRYLYDVTNVWKISLSSTLFLFVAPTIAQIITIRLWLSRSPL